jgi:glycosyltransferase involved in cell wall biosynthesis
MQDIQVDVSVYIITYYHEKYIKKAIESVLRQKTHYSYEIVVSDDGSTDKTMEILHEYEKKYPGKIRVFHNETNVGIPKNIYAARCHCKGKYIVALSGDDYWIDDQKIEKQASFLDQHEEYVAVGNAMELRYDNDSEPFEVLPAHKDRNKVFSIANYEKGETLYTHGFMMRNYFLTREGREYFYQAQLISDKVDDAVDNVLILKKGNVFVLDVITDVYRVPRNKNNGRNYNSRFSRLEKTKNTIMLYNNMYIAFGNGVSLKEQYTNTMAYAFLEAILSKDFKSFWAIYRTIPIEYQTPQYSSVAVKCIPRAFKYGCVRVFKALRNNRGK